MSTTFNIAPLADLFVRSSSPTTNFGANATMDVGWRSATGGQTTRSCLQFDLRDIPGYVTVDSSTVLELVVTSAPNAAGSACSLHKLLSTLSELVSTWESFDPDGGNFTAFAGGNPQSNLPTSAGDWDWTGADFAAAIEEYLDDGAVTFPGLFQGIIKRDDESTTDDIVSIGAKENTTPSNRPNLALTVQEDTTKYILPDSAATIAVAGTSDRAEWSDEANLTTFAYGSVFTGATTPGPGGNAYPWSGTTRDPVYTHELYIAEGTDAVSDNFAEAEEWSFAGAPPTRAYAGTFGVPRGTLTRLIREGTFSVLLRARFEDGQAPPANTTNYLQAIFSSALDAAVPVGKVVAVDGIHVQAWFGATQHPKAQETELHVGCIRVAVEYADPTVPAAPSVTGTQSGSRRATLAITPADDGGAEIDYAEIGHFEDGNWVALENAAPGEFGGYDVTDLAVGTHRFRVRVHNVEGFSVYGDEITVVIRTLGNGMTSAVRSAIEEERN